MRSFKTCLLAFAVACYGTTALAGVINGFAGALLSGSSSYQGYEDPPDNTKLTGLAGYIDFAVFAPGAFPDGLGQFLGYTPTAGQYVYVYQAFETGIAPLSNVSVTLLPASLANNIGSFTGLGVNGQSPSSLLPPPTYFFPDDLAPTSANWDFYPGVAIAEGNPDGSTSGLAFSSPYGPTMLESSTLDDGSFALVSLPSPDPDANPIPEPSTVVFWSCGLAIFGVCRWLRRGTRTGGSIVTG